MMSASLLREVPITAHAVLDAWPIMEWLHGHQPAADQFTQLMASASTGARPLCINRINLGETFYLAAKHYGEARAKAVVNQLKDVPIEIVSVSDEDIDSAAVLKSKFKISYADAFCAVTSINRGIPLVTGDPEFKALVSAGLVRLQWIGR